MTKRAAALALLAAHPAAAQVFAPMKLEVRNALAELRTRAPVSWGVPLAPEDGILGTGQLKLTRGGVEVPAQFTALARWGGTPADSTRPLAWVLLDAQVDLAASETARLVLERAARIDPSSPLRVVRDDASAIEIATGAANYVLSKTAFRLFDSVTLAGASPIQGQGGIAWRGRIVANPATIEIEHQGINRLSLKVRGLLEGNLRFTARLHFYQSLAEVKIDFRLENLTPPALSGEGQPLANNYGAAGSAVFDDLSLLFPAAGPLRYTLPAGERGLGGVREGAFAQQVALIQESSGDARWNALAGMAPRLQSGAAKRASTLVVDGRREDGPNQLGGWLEACNVTLAVERAWQNFPKAWRARAGMVEIGLFPGEYPRDHELRPGEFKTHTLWVRHHQGAADAGARARSFLAPLRLAPLAEDLMRSRAAGLLAPVMSGLFPDYEAGTSYQIYESPQWRQEYDSRTVLDAISRFQHYGWVDYGDIPTDFEVGASPYNLKYDAVRGLIWQALRTGDETWWELAAAAARHAADIDIQHSAVRGYNTARNWFEGGVYGHGYHEEDGRLNPHRNYMNPSTSMSGPVAGLLLWPMVSGDTLVLDSGLESAGNQYWRTVNSDYSTGPQDTCAVTAGLQACLPGQCFGWEPVDAGRTGGNVVQAMLGAYLATGDAAYLDLVRRIAAYIQCRERHSGGDCNRFHFQSIFVRSLGHYLLLRQWLRLPDDAAARSLLAARMNYMTGVLWDPQQQWFRMCYYDDVVDTTLSPIHDNWLLGVADAFAAGGLVLGRTDLIESYGRKVLEHGSQNQFYLGSALSYHSTKEFVNQAGFGQMLLYAAWRAHPVFSQAFDDVPPGHTFFPWISMLRHQRVTSGCGPATFCPDDPVTRGQAAALLVRSLLGTDEFTCPAAPYFTDVPPGHMFFRQIQKLKELGITAGCSPTAYCPDGRLTRGEAAVLIVRARLGIPAGQAFLFPASPYFQDVPSTHPYFSFIQKLRELAITAGCSPTAYCPDSIVSRGQIATFLSRGFLGL